MLKEMIPQDGHSLQKLIKNLTGKQLAMLTEFFNKEDKIFKKNKTFDNRTNLSQMSPPTMLAQPAPAAEDLESSLSMTQINLNRTPHRLEPIKMWSAMNASMNSTQVGPAAAFATAQRTLMLPQNNLAMSSTFMNERPQRQIINERESQIFFESGGMDPYKMGMARVMNQSKEKKY